MDVHIQIMPIKFAVMGFRHGHIREAVSKIRNSEGAVLVGVCEEHAETRAAISKDSWECPVFDSFETLLAEVDCDAVAVGDYYSRRGPICIEALKRGKHVMGDKPLCTDIAELNEMEKLSAESGLSIGCQFSLRENGAFRRLRSVVRNGDIGEVHAISFNGQHPLMYGKRAAWYFEEGKHGGTINDIAIHAIDMIPWITGNDFSMVNAARNWNAVLPQVPGFLDSAQLMMTLENGCGVLGDVSYLSPDSFGYEFPWYWKTVFWGSKGVAEASCVDSGVTLYRNGETAAERLEGEAARPGDDYLSAFLREIAGESRPDDLTSATVIKSSRVSLIAQAAATSAGTNVTLK